MKGDNRVQIHSSIARRKSATRRYAHLEDSGEIKFTVRVHGLNHWYGEDDSRAQVLHDIELDLYPGEVTVLTGPSGSGKTTLLTLIGALRSVQEGSVRVLGRELRGLSAGELVKVRRDIGFIFQAHNLFDSLTALQNVSMSMELKNRSRAAIRRRANELLMQLFDSPNEREQNIPGKKPAHLSGGQRQRVAVARALAGQPKLILADEPTAALDPERARTVVEMLQTFAKQNQCTVVIVTHDAGIRSVADRIVNMNKGGRIESDVLVQEAARIIEFLKANKLFAALPVSTLTEVAVKMTLDVFAPGEEVVRQGEPGDELFVIRSGQADVLVARDGETRKVATLGAGDFFGEAALETGAPRNATVKALERLETYVLGKHDYEQAKAACASFADELRRVLITRQQDL